MNLINAAMHHLPEKAYSEGELRDVLETQCRSSPDLNKAINKTINYAGCHKLINDARLAMVIAQHYAHKGNKFIQNMLLERKISMEHINAGLLTIPDEHSRAWEEAKKKLHILNQNNSKKEQISILTRFLIGRQFNYLIIMEIISQLNAKNGNNVRRENPSCWSKAS